MGGRGADDGEEEVGGKRDRRMGVGRCMSGDGWIDERMGCG